MASILSLSWTNSLYGAGPEDLTFEVAGATATVAACKTSATGTLVIPETYEGRPVTASDPDGVHAKAYAVIARQVADLLASGASSRAAPKIVIE